MAKRQNQGLTRRCRIFHILLGIFALLICASLLGDIAAWAIHHTGSISLPSADAASIGIIGGADGPTAIFITSSVTPLWRMMIKLVLLAFSVLAIRYLKRTKGEE